MTNKKETNEVLVRTLLAQIGDDPDRTGLVDTPARVVRSWQELFAGYSEDAAPKITTFPNGHDGLSYDEMIVDTGTFHSFCEHHMLPFFGSYTFAYIPSKDGLVLGLSKVARVVAHKAARLQVQERLTGEVVDTLWSALTEESVSKPRGIALALTGMHMCKSMRGVKQHGEMTTVDLRGYFKSNASTRSEFLHLLRR